MGFDSASEFIRPNDWAAALAQAYQISPRLARRLLRAAADETSRRSDEQDLLSIWERASWVCEQHVLQREFAAGIVLGYYRWAQRPDGTQRIEATHRAHEAGLQRISDDIDAAIEQLLDADLEIELPSETWRHA